MFKKYLIMASKKDLAGVNITTQLSQFGSFDFYLVEEDMLRNENLDMERINEYDFVIFASKHVSEKGGKTLSVHSPGNWRNANFGGESGKVCPASAIFQKQIFEKLNDNAKKFHLSNYEVTMEATHHGPLIDKPCLFIEIGSTKAEWRDRKAGFVVAKAIQDAIEDFKVNPYNEVAIGIGGPHYCPNFNKIQLNSNVAISHVVPGYVMPISEEMIKEAVDKTSEDIDFVVLDWKGLGKAENRQEVIDILEKNYISWKRTGDVGK